MIPAPVFPQLVMIKTSFPLGQFKIHLDAPALASCPSHLSKGDGLRGIGKIKLDFLFSCHQGSSDHQPGGWSRFSIPLFDNPQTGKVKFSGPFVPFPETDTLPLAFRNRSNERRCSYRSWRSFCWFRKLRSSPSSFFRNHRHFPGRVIRPDMGVTMYLETIPLPHVFDKLPKLMGIAIGAIPADPLKQQIPSLMSFVQHFHSKFDLGLELDIRRYSRSLLSPLGGIFKPLRHDIQPPIHQGMAVNGSVRHENSNLTVVCLAHSARILSSYSRRLVTLLGETRIIKNHNAVWGAKQLSHKTLMLLDTSFIIPGRITQKLLEFPRWGANFLGNVLHILPFNRQQQTNQVLPAPLSAFGTAKETMKSFVKNLQLWRQFSQIVFRHGAPPRVFQEYTP